MLRISFQVLIASLLQLFQHTEILVNVEFGVCWAITVNRSGNSADAFVILQVSWASERESAADKGEKCHKQHKELHLKERNKKNGNSNSLNTHSQTREITLKKNFASGEEQALSEISVLTES